MQINASDIKIIIRKKLILDLMTKASMLQDIIFKSRVKYQKTELINHRSILYILNYTEMDRQKEVLSVHMLLTYFLLFTHGTFQL